MPATDATVATTTDTTSPSTTTPDSANVVVTSAAPAADTASKEPCDEDLMGIAEDLVILDK